MLSQTSAHLTDFNYLGNQTAVVPAPIGNLPAVSGSASNFAWDVPAYSINVLQFDLAPAGSAGTPPGSSVTTCSIASGAPISHISDVQSHAPTTTSWS
jgi:hypothetical protein